MGTTADKLNKVLQTKESIRVAINNKGGMLSKNDTFSSYATAIENIQTSADSICVDYLDIDGTLLKREYLDKGDTTTPPSNPNPDSEYLIFDSWSDTELTNITESKTIYAKYTTKDNATYIFIYIPSTNKEITLNFSGGVTSVDWGDGTIDTNLSHTYLTIGNYVIKVIGGASINYYILGSGNSSCVLKCYISNTIQSLGMYAFGGCSSLISISLPNSIAVLGQNSFERCYSLNSISLPNTLISIGSGVFSNCCSLTKIILPDSIRTLGDRVFSGCYSLTNINLPSSITSLGQNIFENCYSFTNIKLSNNITSISTSTFQGCHSLTSIKLPSDITSIGNYMFQGCYVLTNINLPNNITSLGYFAFGSCLSLTNITLPNNIVSIGTQGFYNCLSLTSIELPSGITSLGDRVFDQCYSLRTVIIRSANVISIQSNSFLNSAYNMKFYVPDNLVEDYKVATNWVNFTDRIYPISSLPKE